MGALKILRVVSRACLVAPMLAGCTIIQVEGPVRVTHIAVGVLRLEPANADQTLIYRSRGLGIVPGIHGVTLGFNEETVAAVADTSACRLVLFDPDRAVIERAHVLAGAAGQRVDTICSTRGMRHAENGK